MQFALSFIARSMLLIHSCFIINELQAYNLSSLGEEKAFLSPFNGGLRKKKKPFQLLCREIQHLQKKPVAEDAYSALGQVISSELLQGQDETQEA